MTTHTLKGVYLSNLRQAFVGSSISMTGTFSPLYLKVILRELLITVLSGTNKIHTQRVCIAACGGRAKIIRPTAIWLHEGEIALGELIEIDVLDDQLVVAIGDDEVVTVLLEMVGEKVAQFIRFD
jgi:hypothetical protein